MTPPDCLVLLAYKDKSDKAQGNKERASFTLEEICGLEAGQWYEGVAFTLAILCLNQAALLGFDSREALQAWDARLRYSLGEGEKICALVFMLFYFFSLQTSQQMSECMKNTALHLTSLNCCSTSQPDLFIHHADSFVVEIHCCQRKVFCNFTNL